MLAHDAHPAPYLNVARLLAARWRRTVYKWVDENGVVHYSDQPHPNAEKVQVQAAQTYKAAPYQALRPRRRRIPAIPRSRPTGAAPSAPATEGSEFANLDALNISVRTDPLPRPGDQIFILLDGAPVNGGAPTGTQFTLTPVERGPTRCRR